MNENRPIQKNNRNFGNKFNSNRNRKPENNNSENNRNQSKPRASNGVSRGQAIRASRQTSEFVQKRIDAQFVDASKVKLQKRANQLDNSPRLKVIALGGMDGGGAKNMIVYEYMDEAIVVDCGNHLGVDLPGVNFGIPDTSYLESIKHKIKAYVITHGHLDHIGALPYILPEFPAPVYGSRFTIGMVEQTITGSDHQVKGFKVNTIVMNQDNHERLKLGRHFTVELVRVTHSIPGSTAVVLDTPVGRIINTGDFRLDPEPLDHLPTDISRFEELAKEGVLLLQSDSTSAEKPGRTPTESSLEQSFHDIFRQAPGRVFVAVFSSNINRIQMLVNAAVQDGRKIAIDGRSMMTTLETAVKLGFIKIPKGTFVPMANVNAHKDDQSVIICTGSQGEPNSALVRMSTGEHKHVKMKEQDTVILSSTPIPESGNDANIGRMVDNLVRKNVHVFRHATKELDNCGPLHVSGHAGLEEYGDLIELIKPKFFMPIYGAWRSKNYHLEEAIRRGVPRKNTYNVENGEVMEFTANSMESNGGVAHGTVLVDQTGAVVSGVVVKDRLLMAEQGIVAVVLTIDKKTGQLLTSPDIISRGFIYMRDNEELMNNFRTELRRVVNQRFSRVDLDRFKQELKDHITYYLFDQTQRSPIVIPVVNVVSGRTEMKKQMVARTELQGQDQPD